MLSLPRNTGLESDIKLIRKVDAASVRLGGCQGHGIREPRVKRHCSRSVVRRLARLHDTQAPRFKIALTFGELHQDLTHSSRSAVAQVIGKLDEQDSSILETFGPGLASSPNRPGV